MLIWHVVDGADGDLARMTGRASATGRAGRRRLRLCRQRHHVFRLRLPARRHAGRLGLGAGGRRGRLAHRPDQPCRDPAPPLSVAGLWRPLAAQRRRLRRRLVQQGELVHPLVRLLGGRLCLAVQPDEPQRQPDRRGAGEGGGRPARDPAHPRDGGPPRVARLARPAKSARRQSQDADHRRQRSRSAARFIIS